MTSDLMLTQANNLARQYLAALPGQSNSRRLPGSTLMTARPHSPADSLTHGQAVSRILAKWQAKPALQAAALLHSLYGQGVIPPAEITTACGEETAALCQHYFETLYQPAEPRRRGKILHQKRIKLYMAAYQNPDLAFLGVANLWDHFRFARRSHDPHLQRAFIDEATDVLIPLLDMLGMWRPKLKVETWVKLRSIRRQDLDMLHRRIALSKPARQQAFQRVEQQLRPVLPQARLHAQPLALAKIYNPILPGNINQESLQKVTIDVLVDTEAACYEALRWIHHLWQPLEQKITDYIGACKLNGYRCLETTVTTKIDGLPTRLHFNIQTQEMDRVNQWGIAAAPSPQSGLAQAWWNNRAESYGQICAAPAGALPDVLYVFSPQGQLFKFACGSTVVDYAYQVHSEVAAQTKRFMINGETVSPAAVLRHLDLVQLERDPQFAGPTPSWLNAARTARARSDIDRFLKRRRRGKARGRELIDIRLKELANHYRLDIPAHRVEQALKEFAVRRNLESVEQLLADVAAGRAPIEPVLHPLFSDEVVRQIELPAELNLSTRQLTLAQCCKPRPGDSIVGRPRYQAGQIIRAKVHQTGCQRVAHLPELIPLKWQLQPRLNAVARLEMTALAKNRLLQDALRLFDPYQADVTLHKVDAVARNGTARLSFTVEAKHHELLETIAQQLEHLPGHSINSVRQMRLTFSEREELVRTDHPAAFNPYRRQPVKDRDMFFGRTQELAYIQKLLSADIGTVFVQGQKRVGKTSLLLYLKKHYLNRRSKVPVYIDFQLLSQTSGPGFFYEIASAVYSDLQADNQINHLVDPPLKELFERAPAQQLIDYLQRVQSQFGLNKLVLLIDEFSRTIDEYQHQRLNDAVFHQWRGIVQATTPKISYVMVVQAQTYHHLQNQANDVALTPIWQLLELGATVPLPPLTRTDAQQLIERPTYNHLEYSPQALGYIWRLTGGSPFLIHAFCYELVNHMAAASSRQVTLTEILAVRASFLPAHNEGIFAHLLNVIYNIPHGALVCHHLAVALNQADSAVRFELLAGALPNLSAETLAHTLQQLEEQHILAQPADNTWQFASLLFGHWLLRNRVVN